MENNGQGQNLDALGEGAVRAEFKQHSSLFFSFADLDDFEKIIK